MRLSLIGPGDIEFHFQQLLKIPKEKLEKEFNGIAKALAESVDEIEILPDNGTSFRIAKLYRQYKGKKLIGAYPNSDKTFGVKHLEPFINEKINSKPLFDEFIDTENWFKHDLIKGLLGDAILYLGSSPGTNGELNYAVYLYKIMTGRKEGLEVAGKYIHPEIKADKNFAIFIYSPFLINKKLPPEEEAYIKKFNINLVYVNNPEELKKELEKFYRL